MSRQLLSPVNAAEVFDVHAETLRRLYRAGRIPGYKLGRFLRFDPDEVLAALRADAAARPAVIGRSRPDFDAVA